MSEETVMRYLGKPFGMWVLYKRSFKDNMTTDLGISPEDARRIIKRAKTEYRKMIDKLPEFEKGDRFTVNIINCSLLTAILLCLKRRPSVEEVTAYYEHAMSNTPTKIFCRMSAKKKFSKKDIDGMKATAALNAADRNPYSWNMDYIPYEDGSGYEARFYKCGICALMKEYGFYDLVPAMCHLDYTMSDLGGASYFVRKYTLASGGPYCDCGYKKR